MLTNKTGVQLNQVYETWFPQIQNQKTKKQSGTIIKACAAVFIKFLFFHQMKSIQKL